jgi:hypothetical protein
VKVGTPDSLFQIGRDVTADRPLVRSVDAPPGGPRTVSVRFNNFGPDAIQVRTTVFVRTGRMIPTLLAGNQ